MIFGTPEFPLRVSSVPGLLKCSANLMLQFENLIPDRDSSPAADTGTLVHKAAELWHADPLGNVECAWAAALAESPEKSPLADPLDARKLYDKYVALASNTPGTSEAYQYGPVIPELQEIEVYLTLEPDDDDPTGEPVYLVGHCDQVRLDCQGVKRIWDIKTTRKTGEPALHEYSPQLALYALATAATIGEPVEPGGLILLRGKHPMFSALWTADHALMIADAVRRAVAHVRRRDALPSPGDYCKWCAAGGLQNCVPLIRRLTTMATSSTLPKLSENQSMMLADIKHRQPIKEADIAELDGRTRNALENKGLIKLDKRGHLRVTADGKAYLDTQATDTPE